MDFARELRRSPYLSTVEALYAKAGLDLSRRPGHADQGRRHHGRPGRGGLVEALLGPDRAPAGPDADDAHDRRQPRPGDGREPVRAQGGPGGRRRAAAPVLRLAGDPLQLHAGRAGGRRACRAAARRERRLGVAGDAGGVERQRRWARARRLGVRRVPAGADDRAEPPCAPHGGREHGHSGRWGCPPASDWAPGRRSRRRPGGGYQLEPSLPQVPCEPQLPPNGSWP